MTFSFGFARSSRKSARACIICRLSGRLQSIFAASGGLHVLGTRLPCIGRARSRGGHGERTSSRSTARTATCKKLRRLLEKRLYSPAHHIALSLLEEKINEKFGRLKWLHCYNARAPRDQ
jgi:hypothetical protein